MESICCHLRTFAFFAGSDRDGSLAPSGLPRHLKTCPVPECNVPSRGTHRCRFGTRKASSYPGRAQRGRIACPMHGAGGPSSAFVHIRTPCHGAMETGRTPKVRRVPRKHPTSASNPVSSRNAEPGNSSRSRPAPCLGLGPPRVRCQQAEASGATRTVCVAAGGPRPTPSRPRQRWTLVLARPRWSRTSSSCFAARSQVSSRTKAMCRNEC